MNKLNNIISSKKVGISAFLLMAMLFTTIMGVLPQNVSAGEVDNGKVVIEYEDLEGNEILEEVIIEDQIDTDWESEEEEIDGFKFKEVTGETEGNITKNTQYVTYIYSKIENEPVVANETVKEENVEALKTKVVLDEEKEAKEANEVKSETPEAKAVVNKDKTEDTIAIASTKTEDRSSRETKTETKDIKVSKVWATDSLKEAKLNLMANGTVIETAEVSPANDWKHTFTDLDVVDNDGKIIDYAIEEVNIDGYKSVITGNDKDGFVIRSQKLKEDSNKVEVDVDVVEENNSDGTESDVIEVDVDVEVESEELEGNVIAVENVDKEGNPLEGATFGIYTENGDLVQESISDANGRIVFSNLDVGEYVIKEIEPAKGYQRTDEIFETFVDENHVSSTSPAFTFESAKVIKTGVSSPIGLALMLAASLLGLGIISRQMVAKNN